ncbi:DNA mismatch repair protein MutT [Microbacterium mangrovi]|uniref:DNA mismatch repair protein MutT n=1 Tax=Microbacterium mangrovi TaxID=1348253 RepID=A0A0B2A3U4_9MICO|nr:NUDIX hydrolase [Microbacterium mangrovi]KHK96233.1 DNA mismatch repair protein MutT [Microbacterium mangrovi]
MSTAVETAVYAAGGVIWRIVEGKLRVLVVHRGRYRDVSLPKGKVDPGEMLAETAVREIAEETGIRVALGVPVGISRYVMPSGRQKIVHYWAAQATEEAIRASTFVPNHEIAALEWLSPKKLLKQLSYAIDVEIAENFLQLVDDGVLQTFPVIAQRHARSTPREDWKKSENTRPLTARGVKQAKLVARALRAFGPQRIVTSPAVRCVQTVQPLAELTGIKISQSRLISQAAWEEGESDARYIVGKTVRSRTGTVLCSHGPVLPEILSELALATGTLRGSYLGSASALAMGGFSVVHLSAANPGSGIVTIETHEPNL